MCDSKTVLQHRSAKWRPRALLTRRLESASRKIAASFVACALALALGSVADAQALEATAHDPGRVPGLGLPITTGSAVTFPSLGDSLGLSPFWDWKTIETAHFRITFPAEIAPIAQKAAGYLEEAHAYLSPRLQWTPRWKTQIVMIDNADAANGLTSAVQRFGIVLYSTPPEEFFSTAYYDDWLRLLCIHEYTHLLNMDTTGSYWDVLRFVIGDVLLPNSLWPSWMLEGLAVYMETRLTHSGRGRSPYYEMILRSAVEANALDRGDYVTLDRVNGPDPYFPGGEVAYLFGYELMNQVASSPRDDLTLGVMSSRSGSRVPYFINGNVENVSGKDWYHHWADFVLRTQQRMRKDLDKIRAQPLSRVETLVSVEREGTGPRERVVERANEYGVLGAAASPDGKWIAYTQNSLDRRSGLYLMDLSSGQARRLDDKMLGVGLAFTPDSRFIVYSRLHESGEYYQYSDLAAYDIVRDRSFDLTSHLRARDPDVSSDGKFVTFARAENGGVGIAESPLELRGDRLEVGSPNWLAKPNGLDRATTPRYSPDGSRIVFALHRNGDNQVDLLEIARASGASRALVRDGNYNRWPAFKPDGTLYFVSDRTGVDNLQRLGSAGPEMVSNVTTGIWAPTFGPADSKGEAPLYASVFSLRGWNLARVQETETRPEAARVAIPPAPQALGPDSPGPVTQVAVPTSAELTPKNYSVWPSILPRQWLPIAFANRGGAYVGGQIFGFDAIDRHRYLLGAAYDSSVQQTDWIAAYSNRSFGPNVTVLAAERTTGTYSSSTGIAGFWRKRDFDASVSYPFHWTYSSLTPALGLNAEREFQFSRDSGIDTQDSASQYVPSWDASLTFSNAESSKLAISPERGIRLFTGTRSYSDSGTVSWKGLVDFTGYVPVSAHSVLVPRVRGGWVSRASYDFHDANVVLNGRSSSTLGNGTQSSFDEFGIRGYPLLSLATRSAVVSSLDYLFPIARIHRGWGTNPVYLADLWGFGFAENTWLRTLGSGTIYNLPAAGGGLRLGSEILLRVPLVLSLEYHHGFRDVGFTQSEVVFGLGVSAISF